MRSTTTRIVLVALSASFCLSLIPSAAFGQQQAGIVSSPLTQALAKVIPELASGYIDFNNNGKPDAASDMSELVPESRVKDGQLQAQEILDFIVANWRFIPLEKLKAVREAVRNGSGAINELIAIDFSALLDDAISQRESMGDLLYLTPAAYKEAMSRMGGIITAMSGAYRKEGQKAESEFMASRDQLFDMIAKGYPLPEDIPAEERATLSTAMVSTILKERTVNQARTRVAIKTLGRLKSAEGASWLLSIAAGGADGSDTAYQIDAMRALGEVGYKPALPVLVKLLRSSKDADLRKAAIQALGQIGSAESLDAILELLKPANKATLPKDILAVAAQALAGIAQKGNADPRIALALRDLSSSDDSIVRKAVVSGLGAFPNVQSTESLLAILNADKDPGVRVQAVASLSRQKGDTIAPAFMKVLREKDLDPALEIATIDALGDNPGGAQALSLIVDDLADKDEGVRASASRAIVKLYPANQQLVTASITKSLLASQEEAFLVSGTALLSTIADASTLPALLTLLQSPLSEVKRNVTWALYKIRSSANPRVMDELQKLITNENESLAVRINAVRAAGAIGYDSAQLNLWQTLVTTAQMRGEKYAMLRFFAVRSLGQIGAGKPQVSAALGRIALREGDLEIRKEAVIALRNLAATDPVAEESLAAAFAQADDDELRILIVEALADMGSDRTAPLAGDFLASKLPAAQKRRLVVALSQAPSEASAMAILDACRDPAMCDFAEAVLEGYPASLMKSLVERRLRTEADKGVISALNALASHFAE